MQKEWFHNLGANIVGGLMVLIIMAGVSFLRSEQIVRLLGGVPRSEFGALKDQLDNLDTRLKTLDARTHSIDITPNGETTVRGQYGDVVFSGSMLMGLDPKHEYTFWVLDGSGKLTSYCDTCDSYDVYPYPTPAPSKPQRKKP